MHKKKNKDSVLAGEMILTFYKTGKRKKVQKNGKFDLSRAIDEILEGRSENRIFGEYLFNRIVIEAWKESAIESLNLSKSEFSTLLEKRGWQYDEANHYWIKDKNRQTLLFEISR
jgi:hypothetical protein